MGNLEKNTSRKGRTADLQKIVLRTISTAGIMTAALVAPNVLGSMHKMGLIAKPRQREYVASAASKLRKKGLIQFSNGRYSLTREGEKLLKKWEFFNYKIRKPSVWDNKWRVVIFDIPEKKKTVRDRLTLLLRQAGFERLQDSVWVYPYDCEDMIGVLKTDFGVGKNILYMIVEELENDKHLREQFDLLN